MQRLPSSADGFSLIEVVASLFLVGTLLVAILTAQRQHVRQLLQADRRLEAIAALDQLLLERTDPGTPTDNERPDDKLPGENPFYWRSQQRTEPATTAIGAAILRIEVFDPDYLHGKTLAAVELLVASSGAAEGTARDRP
ncbi:MAG: type II secretion system protein [Planctomycetales bacterium]|nr:type II secretion system protein [Planctomycetales bacterium]